MEEPYEVIPHVRICAGGGQQRPSLPRYKPVEAALEGWVLGSEVCLKRLTSDAKITGRRQPMRKRTRTLSIIAFVVRQSHCTVDYRACFQKPSRSGFCFCSTIEPSIGDQDGFGTTARRISRFRCRIIESTRIGSTIRSAASFMVSWMLKYK